MEGTEGAWQGRAGRRVFVCWPLVPRGAKAERGAALALGWACAVRQETPWGSPYAKGRADGFKRSRTSWVCPCIVFCSGYWVFQMRARLQRLNNTKAF